MVVAVEKHARKGGMDDTPEAKEPKTLTRDPAMSDVQPQRVTI
jgi:hypothetical protein